MWTKQNCKAKRKMRNEKNRNKIIKLGIVHGFLKIIIIIVVIKRHEYKIAKAKKKNMGRKDKIK